MRRISYSIYESARHVTRTSQQHRRDTCRSRKEKSGLSELAQTVIYDEREALPADAFEPVAYVPD